MPLLSVLLHHSEPGDPVLLDWIRHIFDNLIGLSPFASIIGLGLIIVSIPVGIMAVFMMQRAKFGSQQQQRRRR